MRRFIRAIVRRYKAYIEWFEGLPPEVQAELLQRQNQHL
jgi:hypothetical protein